MDKKFVVLVSGIGDTLLSDNSHRKLKNNKNKRLIRIFD